MGYREDFFDNNPGVHIMGKRGRYYLCVKCGKYYPKSQIDVDHKLPKRCGGTDDIWNLQATCKHCNRSKQDNPSGVDIVSTVAGAMVTDGIVGGVGKIAGGVARQAIKDALGIKYKR